METAPYLSRNLGPWKLACCYQEVFQELEADPEGLPGRIIDLLASLRYCHITTISFIARNGVSLRLVDHNVGWVA